MPQGASALDVDVTDDGEMLYGWYARAKNPIASAVYCHGNTGNMTTPAHAEPAEVREDGRSGGGHVVEREREVREAEALMTREGMAMLDTTTKSIEEIATTILHRAKLQRHVY